MKSDVLLTVVAEVYRPVVTSNRLCRFVYAVVDEKVFFCGLPSNPIEQVKNKAVPITPTLAELEQALDTPVNKSHSVTAEALKNGCTGYGDHIIRGVLYSNGTIHWHTEDYKDGVEYV